ncbi:hypothetical protein SUGI_1132370 [Cryptomeria japonica]|nr:hypothetical protein SUGI_1132370 [Cryptomeria japonica]
MEFKWIHASGRTPERYRLATLEEVKKNRGILDISEARVLDGVALDEPDLNRTVARCLSVKEGKIQVDWFPRRMIVCGQTPIHVPRIPRLLRKELYSRVSLDNQGRIIAFLYSLLSGDIEVIYWLQQSATSSQLDDMKAEYKEDSDGFFKIVKWILFENEEIEENEVPVVLNYALRDTSSTDHAIAIVEIIWGLCSKKEKLDLVYSQIDRVAVSIGDNKHTAVLAKLLSGCAVEELERWNGIIAFHFGKLFKEAVERGYISIVKYLLKLHSQHTVEDKLVREVDDGGKTLLHYSAEWGLQSSTSLDDDVDIVSISLFKAYENEFVKKVDHKGRSVLHIASLGGRDKFCEFLVYKYDLENVVDEWGQNFLHYAAQGKNGSRIVDLFQIKLLRGSGLVSCRNNKGETPLHEAAKYGNTDMINSMRLWCKSILKQTLKQTDYGGRTPLHLAALYGQLETVKELLNVGSDPLEERDISGKTALHNVVANTSLKSEDAIALINVLVDHFDKNEGQKALFLWASAIGIGTADETEGLHADLKQFLKRKKSSFGGINLLKEAALQGNSRLMWELLNRGGDITQIPSEPNLSWVRTQLEKFSEQATDRPTIRDTLGRHALAECIAAHFLNPYIKSPITVSITGGSGMGKTSLMNTIEAELLITAAQLAFPYLWKDYEDFNGAKSIVLSEKGKGMCDKIEEEVANLLARGKDREFKKTIKGLSPRQKKKKSLVYFLEKYRPGYEAVYKYLACMDFNQLLVKIEEDSVYESQGQSLGAVPRILTVDFNAGNYRGRHQAWAGLALEIVGSGKHSERGG